MKKALLVMMMLSACADLGVDERLVPEEPTVSDDAEAPMVSDRTHDDPPEAEEETEAEEPEVVPVLSVPVVRRSAVEEAPSFYMDYFDPLPIPRRRAQALFSRTEPEEFNLRGHDDLREVIVLVLSRLCVSEANWIHDERFDHSAPGQNHAELDCPAIYRVLRRTRADGETLLGTMRRHAHYVTEEREPHRPRMRWISQLQLSGRRPAAFPVNDRDGNPLNWERDYQPRWLAMQAFVRSLLRDENLGPCASAPIITWGGRCDVAGGACDDHLAVRRGLVPYELCGDTANRFWCRPGTPGCPMPAAEVVVEPVTTVE